MTNQTSNTSSSSHSNSSSSHAPPPPPKSSKKQALVLHKQQQQQANEPWLFQSIHVLHPLPALPSRSMGSSLSSPGLLPMPSSLASPSPFYLDVESLRTLLPATNRRNQQPRSSEGEELRSRTAEPHPQQVYGSPQPRLGRNNYRRTQHVPVRLDALATTGGQPRVAGRRKHHRAVRSARPTSVHRKLALRIDAAKARHGHSEPPSTGKKKNHKDMHSPHKAGHQRLHGFAMMGMGIAEDDALDGRAVTPPPPLEDLDEARRQKAAIASQLGLTLEEYEALDEAFADKQDPDDAACDGNNDGSMTERYRAVFAQYDVDGSGAISPDELRELLLAAGEDMDDAELATILTQADTDGDGEINFDEFMGLMRARKRLLLVAKTMGVSGTGPSTVASGSLSLTHTHKSSYNHNNNNIHSLASPLPPLKLVVAQNKRHLTQSQFNRNFSRPTPTCLRPGAQVDMTQLRRELAMAEFGIQELNSKVRDGVHWVQQHCPVNSLKAQIFCHKWGMEKVHALFQRLQSQALSRAYLKWKAFLMYERNKVKANLFLKCKGSQKMTEIMNKWTRKTLRKRFTKWKTECAIDARNEAQAAVVELQRIWKGKLARLWKFRGRQEAAASQIQKIVRGRLARRRVQRLRQAKLEHDSACVLQRCYRGYNGKRLAKTLFKAQQDALAARRIQRAFRNHQKRRLLKAIQRTKLEHDSAIQLQCCMRSYLARKERKSRAHQRRRVRSSILIQRHTRGHLARQHVAHKKQEIRAAIVIQTRYRAYRSRWQCFRLKTEKTENERRLKERNAAIVIQTSWRAANAKRKYVAKKTQIRDAQTLLAFRRLTSAVRIQCVFRGYRARRHAQKMRYDKLKWMNFTVMNQSALKIQACWRGFHGRLASQLRLQAKRALDHEEQLAAKKIQSIARGKLARGELHKREQKRKEIMMLQQKRTRSALQIQRVFRGKQARKRALQMKKAHQDHARAALDRLVQQTKIRAAIKIQCCVRRFLAHIKYARKKREAEKRKLDQEKRLHQELAAIVIQCFVRRTRARRVLLQQRRDFEKRISLMASEKAQDEIERLRQEQEDELARLRVQLLFQESKASDETAKLRKQLEKQREEESERRGQEAQEIAKLKLEALMQQHAQVSDRKILEYQKQHENDKIKEQIEKQLQETKEMEEMVRTQENEELARIKMTALLQTTTIHTSAAEKEREQEARQLQQEASHLQRATLAMKREQAKLKIQSVCLKHISKRRIQKLHAEQAAALAALHSDEERIRVKALQEKEMALAKLKAMMDDDARAREQEIKALEAQMLERARVEKERIAKRVAAARKIQARVRGFLGRQRVKAIQRKIDKERDERAKTMEDQLAAAEAKMAQVMNGTDDDAAGGGESGSGGGAAVNPDDWVEYWDENAQASYFYNIKTQEASWTRPFSAPASSKALEIVAAVTGTATGSSADYEDPNGYAGGYAPADANGYSAEGYADEYGFYDQYGQYHYYEEANNGAAAANANAYPAATMQAAMAMNAGMMYPGYAAAAAAAYAYQTAMAFSGNSMLYGAGMAYNSQMMMPQMAVSPMMMNATTAAQPAATATAPSESEAAVPPDPWEKFFDQYSGAAYFYNNLTGERYWA